MAVRAISTGLPNVDLNDDKLKYMRTIEILEKVNNISDTLDTQERLSLKWILDLGDLERKIQELHEYWATNVLHLRR